MRSWSCCCFRWLSQSFYFFRCARVFANWLQQTVKTDAGVTFYLRSFLLVLFLSALSAAIGPSFDLKPDSRFMEYVWKGAEGLSGPLEKTLWFTVVYAVLVTILVATLKIKDDK